MFFVGNDFEDESPVLGQRTFASGLSRNKFFKLEKGKLVSITVPVPEVITSSSRDILGIDPNASLASRVDFALLSYSKLYYLARPILLETPLLRAPLVWAGIITQPMPISPKYAYHSSEPARLEADAVVQAILSEFRLMVEADGAKFGVVLIPERLQIQQELLSQKYGVFGDVQKFYDFEKPQRMIRTFCATTHTACLDLYPPLRSYVINTQETIYFLQDGHWNTQGQKLAALEIEKWLKEIYLTNH